MALKKVSVPSSSSDFRQIAFLCFLSKVLEKLSHDQMTSYLEKSGLLGLIQTGVRIYNGTETELIKLTDDIRMSIDKRLVTSLLFFDFSKTFDTISPSRLLVKLKNLSFLGGALRWIESYLRNQAQCVLSGSTKSEYLTTNLGVPQVRVLGPLLFCLYVNDLKHRLNEDFTLVIFHIFYADDLQIYFQVPIDQVFDSLDRKAGQYVTAWAYGTGLTINVGKSKQL